MGGVVVRAAVPDDVPSLQVIFSRAALSNAGDRAQLLAHPEHLVLDVGLVARGRTWVATVDDTVIAFASTSLLGEDALELDDLFTDPGWRRRGAARALVRRILAEAVVEGRTRLDVVANAHASAFYRAAGFVADGSARTVLGGGVRMHLAVAAPDDRTQPSTGSP